MTLSTPIFAKVNLLIGIYPIRNKGGGVKVSNHNDLHNHNDIPIHKDSDYLPTLGIFRSL